MGIQTGDIILVKGHTPFISRIIKWFTKSEYTHVGIAYSHDLIFEIDMNRQMGIYPIRSDDYDVFRYKEGLTHEQKKALKKYAIKRAYANEGYDWKRIIRFAIERFINLPYIYDTMNKEVCSEIADNLYGNLGIDIAPDRSPGDVRPCDIANSPVLKKVKSVGPLAA